MPEKRGFVAITIKDISRAAGVSTATVSKVLNGDYRKVSDETRDRILKIADEMAYRPNLLARGLVSRKLNMIGIVIPDISNPYYGNMARGISDEAYRHGYTTMISNTDGLAERLTTAIETMAAYSAAGIIVSGGFSDARSLADALKKLRMPYVFLECHVEGLDYCVYVDDYAGSYKAVSHLIERGHTQIACISGNLVASQMDDARTRGYKQALWDNQITLNPYLLEGGSFTFDTGYRKTLQLLARGIPFTAIVCGNDLIAMGAYKAIREQHLQIPQDISLVGFDDLFLATVMEPRLTTVKQPSDEMGICGMNMLADRIEKKKDRLKIRRFEPVLVERESVSIRAVSPEKG